MGINILNRLFLQDSVLNIGVIKTQNNIEKIIALTQGYKIYEIQNNNIMSCLNLIKSTIHLHKYSKAPSLSDKYICFPQSKSNLAYIKNLDSKLSLLIKAHKSDISASNFSKDGKYFVSGGEDGRTYIYEIPNFRRILSLPPRPDYISSLVFSNDSRFLFVACFDKSNIIFDVQRAKVVNIFNTSDVVESGDFFDKNQKAYLILRNEHSIIYDIKNNQIENSSNPFISWVSTFYIDHKSNLAIVGSRGNIIYIIDLKTNTKIFSVNLDNVLGISSIIVHLDSIFIGCIDGSLIIISYADNNEFFNVCKNKRYKQAREMLDKNIFLSLLPCAKIFDEDWNFILQKATKLLGLNRIDAAINLVEPFIKDKEKKEVFDFYLSKKDDIRNLKELIANKQYEDAYSLVIKNKFLSKTTAYEELENIFTKAFNSAKKLLEEDIGNVNSAKKLLDPFIKTPKKELIMQILNNLNTFKEAEELVKNQKFREYFALTSKHSFLQELELYKKVLILGNNFFDKAKEAIIKSDYDDFYKIAKFLSYFPTHKESITNYIISVDRKIKMISLIRMGNKSSVYKLAMEHEELQYIDEFIEFCKDFEDIYKKSLEFSFKGNLDAIRELFNDYIGIEYWYNKIMSVFKIAYIVDFKNAFNINPDYINWDETIQNYIDIFGKDDDIVSFCDTSRLNSEPKTNRGEKTTFKFQKTLLHNI